MEFSVLMNDQKLDQALAHVDDGWDAGFAFLFIQNHLAEPVEIFTELLKLWAFGFFFFGMQHDQTEAKDD